MWAALSEIVHSAFERAQNKQIHINLCMRNCHPIVYPPFMHSIVSFSGQWRHRSKEIWTFAVHMPKNMSWRYISKLCNQKILTRILSLNVRKRNFWHVLSTKTPIKFQSACASAQNKCRLPLIFVSNGWRLAIVICCRAHRASGFRMILYHWLCFITVFIIVHVSLWCFTD